jgi:PAS domain-containing protein
MRRRSYKTTAAAVAASSESDRLVGSGRRRVVDMQRQKHLVLILAREFASNLSTPTLVADARGYLVFYNEAAEAVVGRRFAEVGEMLLDDWLATFEPRTLAAEPLSPERRPARVALDERRPSHLRYLVTSADGVEREIEVTAFPLLARSEEFVGIVAIFWRG